MNNKGFTLIELLAVIVILAIIALIATPIILNIINDARNSAKERTSELVISQIETAYSAAYMLNNGNYPALSQVAEKFSMDGASMTSAGVITVDMAGVTCTADTAKLALEPSVLKVTCTPGTNKVTPELTLGVAQQQSQQGGGE